MNKRDQIWAKLDAEMETSAAHEIARFALGWRFEQLPESVVHMAKRCVLDAIGCAIGGLSAKGSPICEAVIQELGGNEQATIIGSGLKTTVINATIVNSFRVRYLDYNDLGGGGHNSDAIPALLAVAEWNGNSGKDFLTATILSYELGARFLKAISTGDISDDYKRFTGYGWGPDVRGGINLPPALGLLMGLDEAQIASAIGATCVRSLAMNHLDADNEEFVMSKNLRYGFVARDAVMSCLMSRHGFTGPRRGLEGEFGFVSTVCRDIFKLNVLVEPVQRYEITETSFKSLCVNYTTQAGVQSTIHLCKVHDIQPDDIEQITIWATAREAKHTTAPQKKYPRNGESADHSAYYANALAVIERNFGPRSFKDEKFTDPKILDLIDKIEVKIRSDWPYFSNFGGSEILLNDGTVYEYSMDNPHGHHTDPLSDMELEEKFLDMALDYMDKDQADKIVETIWKLDRLKDVKELTELLTFGEN